MDKYVIRLILLITVLTGFVEASTIDYLILNINTRQPVENVSIKLIEDGDIVNTTNTNINGVATYSFNPIGENFSYTLSKLGYISSESIINLSTNLTIIDSITPLSSQGIIRLIPNDITLQGGHDIIVYFKENNRLQGIYKSNETIQLLVNREYIFKPRMTSTDMILNTRNIERYWYIYISVFIAVAIFILLLALVIAVLFRQLRKRK